MPPVSIWSASRSRSCGGMPEVPSTPPECLPPALSRIARPKALERNQRRTAKLERCAVKRLTACLPPIGAKTHYLESALASAIEIGDIDDCQFTTLRVARHLVEAVFEHLDPLQGGAPVVAYRGPAV